MRQFSPVHDPADKQAEAIVFLAQRMWELVHYNTLDSNRLKLHSSETLVDELIEVLQYVDEGVLDEKNIPYLMDEFRSLYSADEHAKKQIPDLEEHLKGFDNVTIPEKIKFLELISVKLSDSKYHESILFGISNGVERNKWSEIDYNLSAFCISLTRAGYSQDYIFKTVIWDSILDCFKNHPLMIYRLKQLQAKTQKGKYALRGIQAHIERVSWHLRRIYRRRNILVHTGEDDSLTDYLVESLHEYFDLLIDGIIEVTSKHDQKMSIENILRHASIRWKSYLEKLASNPDSISHSDYKTLLAPEF